MTEPLDFSLKNPHHWISDLLVQISPMLKDLKATETILDAYGAHNRAYHNQYHIAFLWYCHVTLNQHRGRDYEIAAAIACHDIVYNPQSAINEYSSAEWWRQNAKEHNICDNQWVCDAVMATADHFADRSLETDEDFSREWFVGLDLLPLATPPYIFDQNTLLLRAEFAHLSDSDWEKGRQGFLQKVKNSARIYKHPLLYNLFEADARRNISRHIS